MQWICFSNTTHEIIYYLHYHHRNYQYGVVRTRLLDTLAEKKVLSVDTSIRENDQ